MSKSKFWFVLVGIVLMGCGTTTVNRSPVNRPTVQLRQRPQQLSMKELLRSNQSFQKLFQQLETAKKALVQCEKKHEASSPDPLDCLGLEEPQSYEDEKERPCAHKTDPAIKEFYKAYKGAKGTRRKLLHQVYRAQKAACHAKAWKCGVYRLLYFTRPCHTTQFEVENRKRDFWVAISKAHPKNKKFKQKVGLANLDLRIRSSPSEQKADIKRTQQIVERHRRAIVHNTTIH